MERRRWKNDSAETVLLAKKGEKENEGTQLKIVLVCKLRSLQKQLENTNVGTHIACINCIFTFSLVWIYSETKEQSSRTKKKLI